MKNWSLSFDIVNNALIDSGILKYCDKIIYSVNGDYSEFTKLKQSQIQDNVLFLASNSFEEQFEFPTLNILKKDSSNENIKALYLMNKGASTDFNQPIKDWIETMLHFNVYQYENCLNLLDEYDAVGVDYHENPYKHFSGNFFWTKSSHVKKLPYLYWEDWRNYAPLGEERHAAEAWVCKPQGKYFSLHNTGIPVCERHLHEYPSSNYRGSREIPRSLVAID
jgi:hypothetical protein